MKILDQLRNVTEHLDRTRQTGHTQCMLDGAKNTPNAVILCHNMDYGESLKDRHVIENATTTAETIGDLRGMKATPLAFDHAAIHRLLTEATHEIERLQAKLTERF